jgi:hypothetical protein
MAKSRKRRPVPQDTVGFYLTVYDDLTPVLDAAEERYDKFLRKATRVNEKVVGLTNDSLSTLGALAKSFTTLPDRAVTSYNKALGKINKSLTDIIQPVKLQFSTASTKGLADTVSNAVARALNKTKITMSPTVPAKHVGGFAPTSRSSYRKTAQPPDTKATMRVKKFATGGVVSGPAGEDKVLAALTSGEIVLPKKLSDALLKQTGGFDRLLEMLSAGVPHFASGGVAGRGTYARTGARDARGRLVSRKDARVIDMVTAAVERSVSALRPMQQNVANVAGAMDAVQKETKEDSRKGGWLNPLTYLALAHAIGSVREGVLSMYRGVSGVYEQVAKEPVDDAVTNLYQMNTLLGVGRKELRAFGGSSVKILEDVNKQTGTMGVGSISQYTESMQQLAQAGITNTKQLQSLGIATMMFSKASGVSSDAAATFASNMTINSKLTDDQTAGLFQMIDTYKKVGKFSNTTQDQMLEGLRGNINEMGTFWKDATAQQQKGIARVSVGLQAALAEGMTPESASAIMGKFTSALSGETEDKMMLSTLLNKDFAQIEKDFKSGNAAGILNDLNKVFSMGGDSTQKKMFADFVQMPAEAFGNWTNKAQDAVGALNKVNGIVIDDTKAMKALTKQAAENQTPFEAFANKFTNLVSGFEAFGVTGLDVLGVLKDMNPVWALAGVQLAGPLMSAISGVAGGLLNVGKFAISATAGLVKMTAGGIIKGVMAVARGLGGMFGFGGGGASAAVSGGTSGFLRGLAGGLAAFANPMTIAGVAVVTAALSVLALAGGKALSMFSGPIAESVGKTIVGIADAIGEVAKAGIAEVGKIVGIFMTLEPQKMLLAGAGLAAMGVGLTALGAGFTVAAAGMLTGAAGFMALAKMGVTGKSMGAQINSLAEGFQLDGRKLEVAAAGVTAAGKFILGIAAIGAGVGAMTIGALVMSGLDALVSLVGGSGGSSNGKAMEVLVRQSANMKNALEAMGAIFGGINTTQMEGLAPKVGAVGKFILGVATIGAAMGALAVGAMVMRVTDSIMGAFYGESGADSNGMSMLILAEKSEQIVATLGKLAVSFAPLETLELPALGGKLAAIGEFILGVAKVGGGMALLGVGASALAVIDSVSTFFTDRDTMGNLRSQADSMVGTINFIGGAFTHLKLDRIPAAQAGLAAAAGIIQSYAPVVSGANALTPSLLETIGNSLRVMFGGDANPIKTLGDNSGTIATAIGQIVTNFSRAEFKAIPSMQPVFDMVNTYVKTVPLLAAALRASTEFELSQSNYRLSSVGYVGNILSDFTSKAAAIKVDPAATARLQSVYDMLMLYKQIVLLAGEVSAKIVDTGAMDGWGKISAGVGEVVATANLKAIPQEMPVSKTEVNQMISAYVRGDVTASDNKTHELLQQMIALLAQQGGGKYQPAGTAPTAPVPTSPITDSLATGSKWH